MRIYKGPSLLDHCPFSASVRWSEGHSFTRAPGMEEVTGKKAYGLWPFSAVCNPSAFLWVGECGRKWKWMKMTNPESILLHKQLNAKFQHCNKFRAKLRIVDHDTGMCRHIRIKTCCIIFMRHKRKNYKWIFLT